MKIIITGVTGFVGGRVLCQASVDRAITQIFTLSRKPLSADLARLPKVTPVIHEDFSEYPESLLEKLRGAEACVWMIGKAVPTTDPRAIDIGYSQAACHAFTTHLSQHIPSSKPFRFIYTSGRAAEKNQSSPLWFNTAGRLSRGAAETAILDFARKAKDENLGGFVGIVVRPGLVLSRSWMAVSADWSIGLEELACAMLGIAKGGLEGGGGWEAGSTVLENRELRDIGDGLSER